MCGGHFPFPTLDTIIVILIEIEKQFEILTFINALSKYKIQII